MLQTQADLAAPPRCGNPSCSTDLPPPGLLGLHCLILQAQQTPVNANLRTHDTRRVDAACMRRCPCKALLLSSLLQACAPSSLVVRKITHLHRAPVGACQPGMAPPEQLCARCVRASGEGWKAQGVAATMALPREQGCRSTGRCGQSGQQPCFQSRLWHSLALRAPLQLRQHLLKDLLVPEMRSLPVCCLSGRSYKRVARDSVHAAIAKTTAIPTYGLRYRHIL
jgi:hypothetical protein